MYHLNLSILTKTDCKNYLRIMFLTTILIQFGCSKGQLDLLNPKSDPSPNPPSCPMLLFLPDNYLKIDAPQSYFSQALRIRSKERIFWDQCQPDSNFIRAQLLFETGRGYLKVTGDFENFNNLKSLDLEIIKMDSRCLSAVSSESYQVEVRQDQGQNSSQGCGPNLPSYGLYLNIN